VRKWCSGGSKIPPGAPPGAPRGPLGASPAPGRPRERPGGSPGGPLGRPIWMKNGLEILLGRFWKLPKFFLEPRRLSKSAREAILGGPERASARSWLPGRFSDDFRLQKWSPGGLRNHENQGFRVDCFAKNEIFAISTPSAKRRAKMTPGGSQNEPVWHQTWCFWVSSVWSRGVFLFALFFRSVFATPVL